jgi:hypothetical protein
MGDNRNDFFYYNSNNTIYIILCYPILKKMGTIYKKYKMG